MRRAVLIAAIFVGLGASEASAQSWSEIPCSDSNIVLSSSMKCSVNSATRTPGAGISAYSSLHAVFGWDSGVYVEAMFNLMQGDTYLQPYTDVRAGEVIRSQSSKTRNATKWTEARVEGNTTYRTFEFEASGPRRSRTLNTWRSRGRLSWLP
jgi:hypothetical protein